MMGGADKVAGTAEAALAEGRKLVAEGLAKDGEELQHRGNAQLQRAAELTIAFVLARNPSHPTRPNGPGGEENCAPHEDGSSQPAVWSDETARKFIDDWVALDTADERVSGAELDFIRFYDSGAGLQAPAPLLCSLSAQRVMLRDDGSRVDGALPDR